jgi:hypothetical protein
MITNSEEYWNFLHKQIEELKEYIVDGKVEKEVEYHQEKNEI